MSGLLQRIGMALPIVQAPMAGTSTPAMAAAVTDAGALGSISVAAMDVAGARKAIGAIRSQTDGPFNVNVFCHKPAVPDHGQEAVWLQALQPLFARFGTVAPTSIGELYKSFLVAPEMLDLLVEMRPRVVSFHFGLPGSSAIARLKEAGVVLLATATSLDEAWQAVRSGIDAIVAQGFEAGGHRGVFDPDDDDSGLGVHALTRLLVSRIDRPIIAAGGIMDGAGIAAALSLGAAAAQLGTAFIGCPESSADQHHRAALFGPSDLRTVFTQVISGRPARCLPNSFTALAGAELAGLRPPGYSTTYAAGKALIAAANSQGDGSFGAHWAGQGAPQTRSLPAAVLIETLAMELKLARN